MSEASVRQLLDTLVRYQCLPRDVSVSHWRIDQVLCDSLYHRQLDHQWIYTGSLSEGIPTQACGDADAMVTQKDWPLVTTNGDFSTASNENGYLVAISNRNNPAYLTLNAPSGIAYLPSIHQLLSSNDVNVFTWCCLKRTVSKQKVLSSEKHMMASFISMNQTETELCIHGPSMTGRIGLNHVPLYGHVGKDRPADRVPCLRCSIWPSCASEFLTRPRIHGWPPHSLIERVQQAGCHVVGVGHPHSNEKHIEWRWSFSVAEKELVHAMNDTMFGCLCLLKSIKKKH